jgi:hypothetical protein
MTLGMQVLAMMAPFAGLAVVVLAGFAVSAWTGRRTERVQQRGIRTAALYLPPPPPSAALPPEPAEPRQPAPPTPSAARPPEPAEAPQTPLPPAVTNAELRRWARSAGLRVADRGPVPAHVREAWSKADR